MDNLQTARNFFEQCDYGKGWDACKAYCQQDATFETEAETLSAINTLDTYCDWMTDAIDMFDDNVEIEKSGEIPKFDFKPKSHYELGENLRMLDFDLATRTTGSRFVFVKDKLALLERALSNFMLDIHILKNGYEEI